MNNQTTREELEKIIKQVKKELPPIESIKIYPPYSGDSECWEVDIETDEPACTSHMVYVTKLNRKYISKGVLFVINGEA